ncbi:MAG: monovalent cation/H+ antiporter subunit D family protein [Rhodospirillales bacterium]|nr:monovalent cation/H+ antiporter subunit D family protein [Rhodospirillales bacterium]
MIPEQVIPWALGLPLLGAFGIWITGRWPNIRESVTLITSLLVFVLVASLFDNVAAGENPSWQWGEMLPGLGISFVLEPLGMIFAGIASFLWIVTTLYTIGYMRGHHEKNQTRFYICFAVAISSAIGIAFAGNMLTLFVFYEVLTISTFPLVTHSGTPEAKRAGRVYLGILIGTSIGLQLVGIIWTYSLTGTLDFTPGGIMEGKVQPTIVAILLALYVFGIGKAAVMPFHRWLPAAMVAPTPVSALLHAVAVVKAGVFTVLKITVYIFGIDFLSELGASTWIAYMAAMTILLASLVAMRKDNLKARLAYSTISQLSYIVLGAMMATGLGIIGGGMHIVMHAFGKITLFFCAGAIMVASHKTEISQMRGLGRKMPITFICFLIGSLSIIGLPPFGGVWSKWYLALAAAETDQVIFVAVLMISSLLNVAYLLPIVVRGFYNDPAPDDHDQHHDTDNDHADANAAAHHPGDASGPHQWKWAGMTEAPPLCVGALAFTAAGCLVLFVYADMVYQFLLPVVEGTVK